MRIAKSATIDTTMTMADCLRTLYRLLTAWSIATFEALANFF